MSINVGDPLIEPQPIERVHCSANVLVDALTPQISAEILRGLIWSEADQAFHVVTRAGHKITSRAQG